MKKTILLDVPTETITDIICNKCGGSCKDRHGINFENAAGHSHFGYGSDHDMEVYKFDLCVKCFFELEDSFKIKSYVGEFLEDGNQL